MKKLLYVLPILLGLLIYSCDQNIDYPYEGKDRIQFRHYTINYNQRYYSDSITFSFGLKPDNIEIDTAKIVVEFLGKGSDKERSYKVVVDPNSTTAVVGTHYKAIDEIQKFRPGQLTDTLRIVVIRKNLSTSFRHPETIKIGLRLEPTEDFDLGLRGGLTKRVLLNNYLSEPAWWNNLTLLGYYHPEKWKILISFNKKYANQDTCPFNINNEGRTYRDGLESYLNAVPTFDKETGDRIYLDRMEPQE